MIRGIQPILLSKWSPANVSDLIAVINAYAQPFEIGLMPFINDKDPWGNLVKIIEGTSVKLNIVIHLAFHSKDDHSERSIVSRAGKTYDDFVSANQSRANISICPLLEDSYTDSQFKDILTKVAKKVRWENHPRLNFRRTNNKGGGSPTLPSTTTTKLPTRNRSFGSRSARTRRFDWSASPTARLGMSHRAASTRMTGPSSGGTTLETSSICPSPNRKVVSRTPTIRTSIRFPIGRSTPKDRGSALEASLQSVPAGSAAEGSNRLRARGLPHAKDTQDSTDPNKNAFNPAEREALRYFLGLLPEEATEEEVIARVPGL
jgi:hypothetical protein